MSTSLLLIIDDDPRTEQEILRSFANYPIGIISVASSAEAMLVTQNVSVILCSSHIDDEDGYDVASRLCDYHPAAALFMLLNEGEKYDVKSGRTAGAIGALMKPLQADMLVIRLQEFLDINHEDTTLPRQHDTAFPEESISTLIDYTNGFHANEDLIRQALPEVMEKVLRIQLSHNPHFREMIERIVREIVEREVSKMLQKESE